jgi:histidine kinase
LPARPDDSRAAVLEMPMRSLLAYIRNKLVLKINIPVAIVLLVGTGIWSYFQTNYQDELETTNIIGNAERMSKTIRMGLDYSMMLNSREDIKNIVSNYGELREIRGIRILNKYGDIMFSHQGAPVGDRIPISDPLCQVCHAQAQPLVEPPLPKRIYQEVEDDGEHLLRLMTPILNEPRCAAAPCHYHSADEQVLGALDVAFSLRDKDQLVQTLKRNTLMLAASLFAATFITLVILFYFLIKKPIGKIVADTATLAEGRATPNSNAHLGDEIGRLSAAVNTMGHELIDQQTQYFMQKNLYQNLFEGVPCLITVHDKHYRLLRFNRTFAERFNAQLGDFCYKAYKSRETPCDECPVRDTFADGRSHSTEEVGFYRDGSRAHWIVTTAPIRDPDGKVVAAMEMCLDITSRKALEEQVRQSRQKYLDIFNNITSAVFLVDKRDLGIIDCNRSAVDLYGMSQEELRGRSFTELFAGGDTPANRELILTGRSHYRIKHVTRDGRELFVSQHSTPMEFDGNEVFLVSTRDITTRIETEQQLIQASKMATLGEMATAVAHEINQPMAVIQTGVDLVARKIRRQESLDPAEVKRVTELIATSIERASNIINHMREFGRKSGMNLEPVSVNHVLHRAFEFFAQQLALRNILVEWGLAGRLPDILGQPNRLEQVVINLFTNARDAIEERAAKEGDRTEKRITIRTALLKHAVAIEFADTGAGVPEKVREKIFEPFFTTKQEGKGTGLGLSISYGIIKEHGGTISVTDNPDGGATFFLRFPIHPDSTGPGPHQ